MSVEGKQGYRSAGNKSPGANDEVPEGLNGGGGASDL